MHKLLYVSSTKRDLSEVALKPILATARNNNAVLDVTGLLLYIDGGFLQVLEGQRDVLHELYETIARDPRHLRYGLPRFIFNVIALLAEQAVLHLRTRQRSRDNGANG